MEENTQKTKYYLMSVQTILPVHGDIVEDLFNYDARNNNIKYIHDFHGIVYTIEDVLTWVKNFSEKKPNNVEPYVVKGEEIFFDISEKRTIIERKITIRK